jgi:hypothetical protein
MEFTKDEQDVLKALVKKELTKMKELSEDFPVANSPVLSTISRMKETDIPFMKTKVKYMEFLEQLSKKL